MGEGHGLLVAGGDVCTTQGKARRIEMMAAAVDAFLGTDAQGAFAQQPITAIIISCITRAAELKAVAQLRVDACTTQPVQGLVGKKLGRQGQRALGHPHAIEDHPGHGFARCDLLLGLGYEACIDRLNQTSVLDNRDNKAEMIQAFDTKRFHLHPSPESRGVVWEGIQRRVKGFFSFCTCSMSVIRALN
jgi:hypothetical protein